MITKLPPRAFAGSLAPDENACLEWYVCRTSVKLPGVFPSDHWTALLLQLSSSEPTVLHSVLALSSAHRLDSEEATSGPSPGLRLSSLHQYSKAVSDLRIHLSRRNKDSINTALVACTILIYLEFFCGHYTSGLIHLRNGVKLLQDSSIPSLVPHVEGWLITLLARLYVQARLLRQDLPSFAINPGILPNTFTSTHQARRLLDHLQLCAIDLDDQRHNPALSMQEIEDAQAILLDQLYGWRATLTRTIYELSMDIGFIDSFAYRLLRLYHTVAVILASTCTDDNETRFDAHLTSFSTIISHSIETDAISQSYHGPMPIAYRPAGSGSVSDIGWIPPLYFTAIHCRNHRIRLQAIHLLETKSHKEGIWSSTLAAAIARKVMQLEEQDFYESCLGADEFELWSAPTQANLELPVLPERYRLRNIKIQLPNEPGGKLVLGCVRELGLGHEETLLRQYDLASRRWSTICMWETPGTRMAGQIETPGLNSQLIADGWSSLVSFNLVS